MSVGFRHIRIFLTVCQCENHISQAAQKLMISQPSVSVAIRELEDHFQIRLFDRMSKRLYLTEAGRQFLLYATRLGALYEDMEQEMGAWETTGTIRLGASITVGSQDMAGYVSRFQKNNPQLRVYVRIDHSKSLEEKLLINELDLALAEHPTPHENLIAEPYLEDELTIITPPAVPFQSGQKMSMEEFLSQRFLLREMASGTREIFEREMHQRGYFVRPIWEANSTTAILNAVHAGMGISVLPRKIAQEAIEEKKVCFATVEGLSFRQTFFIVYHRDKLLTAGMKAFIQEVLWQTKESQGDLLP